MTTRSDLIKSEHYWTEVIQLKLYNDIIEFIEKSGISNKEIAKKLGVSKGRVSQILSGENLNFRIDSLVKICLAINKVPNFHLEDVDAFLNRDANNPGGAVFADNSVSIKWGAMEDFTKEESHGKDIKVPKYVIHSNEAINKEESISCHVM
jgi:predicted XRE-type DNA-binding protein